MKLIKYRTHDQAVTAIAGTPGRVYTQVVWIDSPIRIAKVPNADVEKYGREPAWRNKSVKAAARLMLQAGTRLGITKSAKQFLRACT